MVNDQLIRLYQLKQVLALERMSSKGNDLSDNIISEDPQQQQQQQQVAQNVPNESHQSSTEVSRIKSNTSPYQVSGMRKVLMRKNSSNSGSSVSSKHSTKRRSSWRNLINPNYKSRSDEFHKIFCDTIPNNERLIADYSCALHREILIQGRVYISVNYIAFYSNLFTWITKLVIRLRNVSEIYKANTARIIPNAIHIITTNGDKHVFASLVTRDKSYVMLLRIWQNNIKNERMSDQEIRKVVHANYGKDLGMSDNEELKINSPDPITPVSVPVSPRQELESSQREEEEEDMVFSSAQSAAVQPNQTDKNNNLHSLDEQLPTTKEAVSKDGVVVDNLALSREELSQSNVFEQMKDPDLNSRARRVNQNDVIAEVMSKLNELPDSYRVEDDGTSSPASSSTVVIDTPPPQSNQTLYLYDRDHNDTNDGCNIDASLHIDNPDNRISPESSSDRTKVPSEDLENSRHNDGVPQIEHTDDITEPVVSQSQEEEYMKLFTKCECDDHSGQLMIDEEFDMDVDDLFNLIFTNSKFMRTYMLQRGMTDTIITGWRRSNNGGNKSNSSTLSSDGLGGHLDNNNRNKTHDGGGGSPQLVRIKQVRQLNYSMSINHMWAKQVHIEERQSICQLSDGVYVLKSQTKNSGIPYGESFSVDLIYCLTRNGGLNRCRMLVHGSTNFQKDKQNWRLAMVKPLIERQTSQGCNDFLSDLSVSIKDHLKRKSSDRGGGTSKGAAEQKLQQQQLRDAHTSDFGGNIDGKQHKTPACSRKNSLSRSGDRQYQYRRHGSLVRAKSRLKEKKLRSIYRYYIQDRDADESGGGSSSGSSTGAGSALRRRLVATDRDRRQIESGDDSCLSADDSLTSFSDIDDTDSMIMMMNVATTEDDQASETAVTTVGTSPARAGASPAEEDGEEKEDEDQWMDDLSNMDKSFSDVDRKRPRISLKKQHDARHRLVRSASSWRQLRASSRCSSTSVACNTGTMSMKHGIPRYHLDKDSTPLTTANETQLPEANNNLIGRNLNIFSCRKRLIVPLMIVIMLVILCFLIVPQVVILRRLSSLEVRLRSIDDCGRRGMMMIEKG